MGVLYGVVACGDFVDAEFSGEVGLGFADYFACCGVDEGYCCCDEGVLVLGFDCSAEFCVGGAEVYDLAGLEVSADELGLGEAECIDHAVEDLFEEDGFDFFDLGAEGIECCSAGDDCLTGVLHADAVEGDGLLEVVEVGLGVSEAGGYGEVDGCFVVDGLADVVYFFFLFCGHVVEGVVDFCAEGVIFLGGGICSDGAGTFVCDDLHGCADLVGVVGYACGFFECGLGVSVNEG